jgi:hypothetical protein
MAIKIPVKLFLLRTVLVLCGLAAVGTIVLVGFNVLFGGPQLAHKVIATSPAPDGHLTAVLTQISGGQGVGFLVDVKALDGDTARVANIRTAPDRPDQPVSIAWKDNHTLELHPSRDVALQLEPGDVTVGGRPVVVTVRR